MRPFLSVVTVNLNNAKGLRKTIESVLSQESIAFGDLEYLIIDGGSTDESVSIIKEYAERADFPHKISYWVSEKDRGIYDGMNKGIRASHGEYVALLNSGDYYVKDVLRGLKDEAREHEGAILYGAVDHVRNDKFIWSEGRNASKLPFKMIAHLASFVPISVYDKYGLYDESFPIVADWDLFATFKEKGVLFVHLPKIFTVFDADGISSVINKKQRQERCRLFEKHLGKAWVMRYHYNCFIEAITPPALLRLIKKSKSIKRCIKKPFSIVWRAVMPSSIRKALWNARHPLKARAGRGK